MKKKLYFYVIAYHWEGAEELSYYNSPVLFDDKKEFIKSASKNLYHYTSDPRAEVVGFRTISYNITDSSFKERNL